MTLFIKDLVSIGAVDSGDNPEAEIVFWKRRKAKAQPAPGATEGNRMDEPIPGVPEAEAEIEKLETELIEAATEPEPVEKADDLIAKAHAERDLAKAEADAAKAALAVEVAKRRDAELVMKIRDDCLEPLLGKADEVAPNLRALEVAAPEAFAAVYGNLVAAAQRVDLAKAFAEIGSNPGEADTTYEGLRDAYVAKRVAELKQPASPDLIIKLRSEFAATNPNAGKE